MRPGRSRRGSRRQSPSEEEKGGKTGVDVVRCRSSADVQRMRYLHERHEWTHPRPGYRHVVNLAARVRESRTARSATATASTAAYLDGLWYKVTRVEVELEELSSLVHGEGASVFGV